MSASAQPEPTQAEPENKYPDCVFMELAGKPVESRQLATTQVLEAVELSLNLSFNEQWEDLPAGQIRFGIRRGELQLTIKNGKVAYKDRVWNDTLNLSIPEHWQPQVADTTETMQATTDNSPISTVRVTTKGSEDKPVWEFEEKSGDNVLQGSIFHEKLAIVAVEWKPCTIEATFKVSDNDIYVSSGEGLRSSGISRNKKAIIERLFVLRRLKSKFNPYVSRQELTI